MIVGEAAFAGGVCNSSPDIWASDDFAKAELAPAPITSRLKSRRFMALPPWFDGLPIDFQRRAMRRAYVVVRRAAKSQVQFESLAAFFGIIMLIVEVVMSGLVCRSILKDAGRESRIVTGPSHLDCYADN